MISNRWKEVVEVVGILAIVASLLFVGMQVRQDQLIARVQLGSGTSDLAVMTYQMMTVAELAFRECYLVDTGIFDKCDNTVRDIGSLYFGNEVGDVTTADDQQPARGIE